MSVLTEDEKKIEIAFTIQVPKTKMMSYEDFMSDYMCGEDEEIKMKVWKALVKKATENKYDEINLGEAENEEWNDRMDDMTPLEDHIDVVADEVANE